MAFSFWNVALAGYFVLGPLVAARELGGAEAWGAVATGGAAGALLGGAVALRWKPPRPLLAGFPLGLSGALQLLFLVPPFPVAVLVLGAALMMFSLAVFNAFWDTILQQHIPREAISRVSSVDWMVSLVFMPLGCSLAGPLTEAIGVETTLVAAAVVGALANLAVLLVPSVRALRRAESPPAAAPA